MKKNYAILILFSFLSSAFMLKVFAQAPDTWLQKSNVGGLTRLGAVGFSIGTKGYIGTGITTTFSRDFWEYDPITDTWSQKADFGGTARWFASSFTIGTKGYIGCGNDGTLTKDFWEFDPSTNIWTKKADFGGSPRDAATAFSIGSKGFLGTGLIDATTRVNDFWEYDPITDNWTQISNFGGSIRAYAAGFTIGNKGYVGTGNHPGILEKDFWEYNPANDTWVRKADFPGGGRFGAIGIGNEAFGYIGLGDIGGGYTNDFWEYSPTLDTWTRKSDFGAAKRTLATGFSILNNIYIGTGYDKFIPVKYNDFWEYTPFCIPPTITLQPTNQSITYGKSASYSVTATDAISYQWQQNTGSEFVDIIDGGIYSNATTSTLDISLPTVSMTGFKYRCVLTGFCHISNSDGNATLKVTALDVLVTPDASQTKVYGSTELTPFTYTLSPSLNETDIITGQMKRIVGEDVGNYAFTSGTLSAGENYTISVASTPTFSITPVALTITADDKEKCYDGAVYNDAFTVSYKGFVNGEGQNVLGGTLVFGGNSSTSTTSGNYTIEPSGFTSSNYTIGFVNGALVIKPIPDAPVISRSGDTLSSSAASGNQWYKDDVEITGSNGEVYVAKENGTYYSIVTKKGCSSSQSNTILILNVSKKELSAESFDIYPNPNNGKFNIKLKAKSKESYTLEIYNSLGTLVWKQNNAIANGNTINIVDLNIIKSGLYTILLKNETSSFAKKVLINK